MVNKIKLYSMGNNKRFNYYVFDKNQKVIEKLIGIFSEILGVDFNLYESYKNKKGKLINEKIDYNKIKDIHVPQDSHSYDNVRVDVFYGDKRFFVTINCTEKLRLEFNKELSKISIMPKPEKINKKW